MRISKKTDIIKILIFAIVVMFWLISELHLLAVIFARGPLMPWLGINLAAAGYMILFCWATDSNRRKEKSNGTRHNSGDI